MKSSGEKAVKAGLGYTIGNVLIKGITFFSLPIFSRLLSPEEFGVFNVFISYEEILYIVIGLALHSSLQSSKIEFGYRNNEYISSISLIYILNAVIAIAITFVCGSSISKALEFSKCTMVMLVLYSFGSAYLALYNSKLSLDYDYKQYLVIAFCNSFCNVALPLIFILTVFRNDRAMGRIVGATLSMFVLAIILLFKTFSDSKPKFNSDYWEFGIKYSLPIVPHGISQVLLAQVDRIMIRMMIGDNEAGIYSLAGNIKLLIMVINDSVGTVWRTWFFKEIDNNRIQNIQKYAKILTGLFLILSIGVMAISPELVYILGGEGYELGKYVAIPMVIDAFVLFMYGILVQGEYYMKKTTYIMWGTMIATIINLVSNYIFITKFGFIAAAYTTLGSYIFYLILHLVISKKIVGFYVLNPANIISFLLIVAAAAAIDMIAINNICIRLCSCCVIILGLLFWINSQIGILQLLKDMKK